MLRQTSFAGLGVTSAARLGRIPVLAITSERCRPARGRSISRFRSCGSFETAIIERYRRRESSVEEALIEDVSGRHFGAAGRGYYPGLVGHAGEPEYRVEP